MLNNQQDYTVHKSLLRETLKKYWGYTFFRPLQEEIISAVIDNKDVLALMPTGGGKSICFQLPALIQKGIYVVVTPLISLIQDQVQQLKHYGIGAAGLYTGLTKEKQDHIWKKCFEGEIKLLYVAPERLHSNYFQQQVLNLLVSRVVVDEAHCISQWGNDFRPSYRRISHFRNMFPSVPVLALTASATPEVCEDIKKQLLFEEKHVIFKKSFKRENIAYVVRYTENKWSTLLHIVKKISAPSIVYVNTRSLAQKVSNFLYEQKLSVDYYHAGLNTSARTQRQRDWIAGKTQIMVATSAFGMGINKANVRLVVHFNPPQTLEDYYQESGRAGRDSLKAYAVMLYDHDDTMNLKKNIDKTYPEVQYLKHIYQCIANYFQIAIGSAPTSLLNFNIHQFCTTYGLNESKVYRAIILLERQSFLKLVKGAFLPARISILSTPHQLYTFQKNNQSLGMIIKAFLRIYGGESFNTSVNINEYKIAHYLGIKVEELKLKLRKISQLGIWKYDPQNDDLKLSVDTYRYAKSQLPINEKWLNEQRKYYKDKINKVIAYYSNITCCRTDQLTSYFGENNYSDCGHCDICLKRKYDNEDTLNIDDLDRNAILSYLNKKSCHISEIVSQLEPANKEKFISIVRDMIDEGILMYTSAWQIRIKSFEK